MIPNNNLSVLPWYSQIEEQNAQKWWAYGRIYPFLTPKGWIPPFQLTRDASLSKRGEMSSVDATYDCYLKSDGSYVPVQEHTIIATYDTEDSPRAVYFEGLPPYHSGEDSVMAVAKGVGGEILGSFKSEDEPFTGIWMLPQGTTEIDVVIYNEEWGQDEGEVWSTQPSPIESFSIYDCNGVEIGDFTQEILDGGLTIENRGDKDIIIYDGQAQNFSALPIGTYYAELGDVNDTWVSDMFRVVDTPHTELIKITWWDEKDFVMDGGVIVYKFGNNKQFKNYIYLDSEIAKPTYTFEEEGDERNGYFFPTKQISKKVFHFGFLAPEYLLDVLRFVRMSDYVTIEKNSKTYNVDSFQMDSDWEGDGDVASVSVDFSTATVAKKVGRIYGE